MFLLIVWSDTIVIRISLEVRTYKLLNPTYGLPPGKTIVSLSIIQADVLNSMECLVLDVTLQCLIDNRQLHSSEKNVLRQATLQRVNIPVKQR